MDRGSQIGDVRDVVSKGSSPNGGPEGIDVAIVMSPLGRRLGDAKLPSSRIQKKWAISP